MNLSIEKDPAFLFYSKDFYEGTRMLLPEERACFIDLLIYQHQNGFIPNDIKRLSLYCSGINEATLIATLEAKFKLTDDGWINEKLKKVIESRREFAVKQSENGLVGQFFKKAKQSLSLDVYTQLREYVYNKYGIEKLKKELKKEEATHEAMLEAMLKHLAIENENVIEDVNEDVNKEENNKDNEISIITEKWITYINSIFAKKYTSASWSKKIEGNIKKLLKAYGDKSKLSDNFKIVTKNILQDTFHIENNYRYVTPEYVSRLAVFDRFLNIEASQNNNRWRHPSDIVMCSDWIKKIPQPPNPLDVEACEQFCTDWKIAQLRTYQYEKTGYTNMIHDYEP
jgi:rubrerythrin